MTAATGSVAAATGGTSDGRPPPPTIIPVRWIAPEGQRHGQNIDGGDDRKRPNPAAYRPGKAGAPQAARARQLSDQCPWKLPSLPREKLQL